MLQSPPVAKMFAVAHCDYAFCKHVPAIDLCHVRMLGLVLNVVRHDIHKHDVHKRQLRSNEAVLKIQ